jgi:hypothetical protein
VVDAAMKVAQDVKAAKAARQEAIMDATEAMEAAVKAVNDSDAIRSL